MNLKDLASALALEASRNGLNPNTVHGAMALMGNLPDDLFQAVNELSPDQFLEAMSEAGYVFEQYRAVALCIAALEPKL